MLTVNQVLLALLSWGTSMYEASSLTSLPIVMHLPCSKRHLVEPNREISGKVRFLTKSATKKMTMMLTMTMMQNID